MTVNNNPLAERLHGQRIYGVIQLGGIIKAP
jgi:hypothetical protein